MEKTGMKWNYNNEDPQKVKNGKGGTSTKSITTTRETGRSDNKNSELMKALGAKPKGTFHGKK